MTSPLFDEILRMVYAKSPLQEKRLKKYLESRDGIFFSEAEIFCRDYITYLESQKIPRESAVDAYIEMCVSMMKCQMQFMKTGKYPAELASESYEQLYKNKPRMTSYMVGLALSQFLWPTHYEMFMFLASHLRHRAGRNLSYLEIGPGHGIFLNQAMRELGHEAKFTAVDISPVSITITQSIMEYFHPRDNRIRYHTTDILNLDLNEKYDFITMGEVIEHVNTPERILIKLTGLLAVDGVAFVSTCVDCPAIDHVYHFKSIEEIRVMICRSGLEITDERVLPVEELPMEEIIRRKITINYCALVRRKNS